VEGLCQQFGSDLKSGSSIRYGFPSPAELARASEKELRSVGLGFRAGYIKEIAGYVSKEELDLGFLKKLPYKSAKQWLMDLPGVGPKVADCVLLYSLDKLEAFPVDRWIERVLMDWYSNHKQRWVRDAQSWAVSHFGKYAGYAELYLFQHIRASSKQK
jgi:N-glycosylase/DNA lyase